MKLTKPKEKSHFVSAVLKAAEQMGYPVTESVKVIFHVRIQKFVVLEVIFLLNSFAMYLFRQSYQFYKL